MVRNNIDQIGDPPHGPSTISRVFIEGPFSVSPFLVLYVYIVTLNYLDSALALAQLTELWQKQ